MGGDFMPEDNDLNQKEGESKEQYIARLKTRLRVLFEQHIKENEGQPLFASDIKDPAERAKWEEKQLAQWNARHEILGILVKEDERDKEEILPSDGCDYTLELRQRWLTREGKTFVGTIVNLLRNSRNLWMRVLGSTGVDFGNIMNTTSGERFVDFYYVHGTEGQWQFRDLRWTDLAHVSFPRANLQNAVLDNANLQLVCLGDANLQQAHLIGTDFRKADLSGAEFEDAQLNDANLEGADLRHARLQNAKATGAKFYGAALRKAHLEWADLGNADLRETVFAYAKLQGADLTESNLQGANLLHAHLEGAGLRGAKLQGADLSGTTLAGAVLMDKGPEGNGKWQEIHERSADLRGMEYSREWTGPRWAAYAVSFVTFILTKVLNGIFMLLKRPWRLESTKHAWRKWKKEKGTNKKTEIDLKDYSKPTTFWAGRPTTCFGVDTSGVNWSRNPGLKRDIEDEQFIEDFKEKHPAIYWLWAGSSDCGRSIGLWSFWCLAFIVGFAFAYWLAPITKMNDPCLATYNFWTCLYSSVLTFATFGFGSVTPLNTAGAIVAAAEVVCGYIFFGGLIALFTSTLTRRA